jgi:hypothetical protein
MSQRFTKGRFWNASGHWIGVDLSDSECRQDDGWFFETRDSRMCATCPTLSCALAVPVKVSIDGANRCVCTSRLQTLLTHPTDRGVQVVLRWVFGTRTERQPFESVRVPADGCWADVVKIPSFPDKLLMSCFETGQHNPPLSESHRRAT